MHLKTILLLAVLIVVSVGAVPQPVTAEGPTVTLGADIVSRYNWRGLDLGDNVSLQPALKLQAGNFKFGFWGSYSKDFEEIDTWASYTMPLATSGSLTAIITDYYFASAEIKYFNFNNYDDSDGAGAHLLEVGLSYSGPASFPLTVSGYVNVYNDAGNCTYFQLDYPFTVQNIAMGVFVGGTAGSEENPAFYGTDDAQIINIGVKGTKTVQISPDFQVPVGATFLINPNQEIAYLILTLSI